MKNETFNKLDLREQLTSEIKESWFYKQIQWGLQINKHSVVFDKNFTFEVYFKEFEYDDEIEGSAFIKMNGQTKYELFERDAIYDDEDKYMSNPKNILEDILLYIANCI